MLGRLVCQGCQDGSGSEGSGVVARLVLVWDVWVPG